MSTAIDPRQYRPPAGLLRERVILITGAGAGIGRAAATSCAAHGATVILCGRTLAKLEQTYDAITAAGGPQPAIAPLCLETAGESDYRELGARTLAEFGRLDGLLHNAGILGERTSIANYSAASWQRVLQVNLTAEFLLTKALLPALRQSPSAAILFTSSGVGRRGRAFWGAYAVSKFGVEGLSQVLAAELEQTSRIRVNCINPGATRTAMRAAAYPAEDPLTLKTPAELMPAYLYLLGPDSAGVTGQSFDAQ
ncbi:MAG: YciK family oxidoreductase [Pseudomonadota bacterium]|jgi:NAD(P)-dependent dehydrogenase (short-subunit alcohol dehydrogenase family)